MTNNLIYISLTATILCIIGYIPEIYALSYAIYTENEIKPSSDMWLIWIFSALLSAYYAFVLNETYLIINTSTILSLNIIVYLLKIKYTRVKNKIKSINDSDIIKN